MPGGRNRRVCDVDGVGGAVPWQHPTIRCASALSLPQIQLLTTKREGGGERKGRETLLLAGSSFVQVKVYLISKEEEEPRCRFY